MSDRTKLILAVTLGCVGVALGALGTIVAFNARSEVKSNEAITAVVEQKFAEAQKRQDGLEASQASEAEKLVASLSNAEKNLLRKINSNSRSARALRKRLNNQEQQIQALQLTDQQLSGQLSDVQRQVRQDFREVNQRIDRLSQRVNRVQTGGVVP